jgi:predicted Zn finger-like uncharacterized protein
MFKVVPDQLRISDGWVRCGHCAEVFDAPAHLHDPSAPPPAVQEHAPEPFEPMHEQPDPGPMEFVEQPYTGLAHMDPDAAQDAAAAEDDIVVIDESLAPSQDPASWTDTRVLPVDQSVNADDPPEMRELAARTLGVEDDEPEAPVVTPSFVKQADRRAFWRKPWVRMLLTLIVLLLTGALALQAAYQERDRIAAQWPQTRPALAKMCELLRCEISALRKIESVAIEGSSFTRLRPDAYRLNIVLKNNAPMDVAMPSVELTLTDTQDGAVVRRVLTPADMGASSTLAAGAEWNGNIPIAVSAAGGAARVAGYRVLAFYP